MIVLDTNVVSEVLRPQPDEGVLSWLRAIRQDVAITAVTLGELLAGVQRLPMGRRRSLLSDALNGVVTPYMAAGAVLAFDAAAAVEYAHVLGDRQAVGLPIATADAQIAAICRVHSATCATRNTKDFLQTGVELVNPFLA